MCGSCQGEDGCEGEGECGEGDGGDGEGGDGEGYISRTGGWVTGYAGDMLRVGRERTWVWRLWSSA